MRGLAPRLAVSLAALIAAAALLAPAASAAPTYAGKFPITGSLDGSNDKIAAGSDGNMWFAVATTGKDVAKITPSGQITEYDLPGIEGTQGIASGPEGRLWVPTTNKVTSFSPGDPEGSVETTESAFINSGGQIAFGPEGDGWIASANAVAKFPAADPKGIESVTVAGELSPKDIDFAGSVVVIADAGHERLVTFNYELPGMQTDLPLNDGTTTAQGVAGNPNGQIAFSKSDGNEGLGLLTKPDVRSDVLMPGDPFGVALGSDGSYYFAMSAAHQVERLTASGQASTVPFPGLGEWFPRQIAAGPDNTLWVTMEIPGSEPVYAVAKVAGLEPPMPPPPPVPGAPPTKPVPPAKPDTKLSKGPQAVVKTLVGKAKVTFKFTSSLPGSSFQCSLTKVKKPKKGKKVKTAAFSGCKSPKVYKLKPGKYAFQVRAVSPGGADATPAKQSFKVVHVEK